jgi:hypothetical protein
MFPLIRALPSTTSAEADTPFYSSTAASRLPPHEFRPGGSLLLFCKALSSSTACRSIPALFLTPFSPFCSTDGDRHPMSTGNHCQKVGTENAADEQIREHGDVL